MTTTAKAPIVRAEDWRVVTAYGRDYTITRPSHPKVFHLFAAGEYVGEYPTLLDAVANAADLDATDDEDNPVPAHKIERTLTGHTFRDYPQDAVEADKWMEVVSNASVEQAIMVYLDVVGDPPGGTLTGISRAGASAMGSVTQVPVTLLTLFADSMLNLGFGVLARHAGSDVPIFTFEAH